MAKPILFCKIPCELYGKVDQFKPVEDHLRLATNDEYHILITRIDIKRDTEIQVFCEKNFTKVKYNELKEIINKSIKK